jgi:uncharacterized membrane protein
MDKRMIERASSLRANSLMIFNSIAGMMFVGYLMYTDKNILPIHILALLGFVISLAGWIYADMYERKL